MQILEDKIKIRGAKNLHEYISHNEYFLTKLSAFYLGQKNIPKPN